MHNKLPTIIIIAGLTLLSAQADHILMQRVVLTPTNAEMVTLVNPTGATVNLSDYYITDAVKASTGKYYYNLPSAANYWSSSTTDFIARFPAGQILAAGDTLILSMHTDSLFNDYYGYYPDLALFEDLRNAVDGVTTISFGSAFSYLDFLGNDAEMLMLFHWDGSSSTVEDVDYLLWGDNSHAIDKSAVSGYASDTPAASQAYLTPHDEGFAFTRVSSTESGETASGGNGITGHDETSENLNTSWVTDIYPEVELLTIARLLEDGDSYDGEQVILSAVVTVPAGLIWQTRSQIYIQDESLRGIIVDGGTSIDASVTRGDSIIITADFSYYNGEPQLSNYSIELLKSDSEVPINVMNIAQLNTLEYTASFVEVWGKITGRSEPNLASNNTGASIDIQDDTGEQTTVRIWNSTNLLYDENAVLVNPALDSLLQIGTTIVVQGIADEYNGSQLVPVFIEDIREYTEGEEGDFQISLDVVPYPFVPQRGEVLAYQFSYPANARIKIRLYDAGGRRVASLYDEYRAVSYFIDKTWDGRDDLNRYMPPGIYLMHIEVTDIKTGKLSTDMAPVVIGVQGK